MIALKRGFMPVDSSAKDTSSCYMMKIRKKINKVTEYDVEGSIMLGGVIGL